MNTGLLGSITVFYFLVGAHADKVYVASFTDDVQACDGFKNSLVDCSGLKLIHTKTEEGIDACGLSGPMEMLGNMEEGHDINIEIWKELPCDKEMMWTVRTGLCEALKYEDAPWTCLTEAMNIKGCPVKGGTYNIQDLLVSLDFLKDVLSFEFCGDYTVKLLVMSGEEKQACYEVGVNIVEKDDDQ